MASVDSGVETGNDSNDSLSVQHESQQQHVAVDQVVSNDYVSINIRELKEPFTVKKIKLDSLDPCPIDLTFISRLHFDNVLYKQMMKDNSRLQSQKMSPFVRSQLYVEEETDTQSLKYKSSYRPKIKTRTWYKGLPNYMKDWPIHNFGRKIRLAAMINNTMLMSQLLNFGISPNCPDNDGRTPLHHAACRGYTKMVQLLLENGADPNQRDCIGNTPLHLAAVTGKISVVTLLLRAGTNVHALDKYGYNPLQLAKAKLKMLQRNYNNNVDKIKEETHDIVNMLMAYFRKQEIMQGQVETLSNFCSRLSLSSTSDQVQDDVKDLLASIDSLNITG